MKFSNFETYTKLIDNNQKPSVYMALCCIESIIKDIENEADVDFIEELDIGDSDKFPGMLLSIMRTINDIYIENKTDIEVLQDQYERQISKMNENMPDLEKLDKGIRDAMKRISDLNSDIKKAENKKQELEKELAEAEKAKSEYESVSAEVKKAEEVLGTYPIVDLEAKQNELDSLNEKIAETQKKCDEYNKLTSESEDRKQELEKELAEAEKAKSEYESVSAEVKKAEEVLGTYPTVDVEAKQNELDGLNDKIAETQKKCDEYDKLKKDSEDRKQELEKALAEAEKIRIEYEILFSETEKMQEDLNAFHSVDIGVALNKLEDLKKQTDEAIHKNNEYASLIGKAEAEILELTEQIELAEKNKKEYAIISAEADKARSEIESYSPVDIEAEKKALSELNDKAEELRKEKNQRENKKAELEIEIDKLIKGISDCQIKIPELENDIEDNKALYKKENEKKEELERNLKLITTNIVIIQKDIHQINTVKIPSAEQLKKDTEGNKAERSKKLKEINENIDALSKEILKVEEEIKASGRNEQNLQSEYDELQASLDLKSNKLSELQEKIEELKKAAGEDTLPKLISQKRKEIKNLEDITKEIENTDEEIKKVKEKIQNKEAELKRLEDIKTENDNKERLLNEKLSELKPISEEPMISRIHLTAEKLEFFNSIYMELNKSVNSISSILKLNIDNEKKISDRTMDELSELSDYMGVLRKSANEIAQKCTNNIREKDE